MAEISNNSVFLEGIKNWFLENHIDATVKAVLLIGSWAENRAKELSDVDILVIKEDQTPFIQNVKIPYEDRILDVWYHNEGYMKSTVNKIIENLGNIYQISLYLSFTKSCKLWYEKDDFFQNHFRICKDWEWKPEHRIFIKMMGEPPVSNWAMKAYEENIELLSLYENRFDNGLAVTHRLKDYVEMYKETEEEKVIDLYKKIISLYSHIKTEREWTEVTDSRKAIQEKNWSLALVSLKDVLYYLLKRYISPPAMELRDPGFWKLVEERILPQEYISALELAYL
ncbi:MAG: hypothetical protein HeimAB125_20280 [Candidatus Heimdallarchaeota archaeon AB_125]|nr:MAG: hypothetical protein HeimAB125_20280 [Candidatus Heimdallarchaeota archaeon AB_125]